MQRLISAGSIILIVGCSGSDFAGANKPTDGKGKSSAVETKAKDGHDSTAGVTTQPAEKISADADPDKVAKAKQDNISTGFVQNGKVYVPVGKTVVIPVAIGGCRASKAAVATCGDDDKSIVGVTIGESTAEVNTANGPTKLTVIVYDPNKPSDAVINGASSAASAQIAGNKDSAAASAGDDSLSKAEGPDAPVTTAAHVPPPPIAFEVGLSARNMTLEAARAGGNGEGQPVLFPPVFDWSIYRHIRVVSATGSLRFSSDHVNPCPQGTHISWLGAGEAITGQMGLDLGVTGDIPAGTGNACVGFVDTVTQYNDNGYENCTIKFEVTGD